MSPRIDLARSIPSHHGLIGRVRATPIGILKKNSHLVNFARAFRKNDASYILSRHANVVLQGRAGRDRSEEEPVMVEEDPIIVRLIEEARRQAPGAQDRLLESYRNYLRLMARTGIDASLRGKADPSDLVQETLIKAHQHFDQFQGQTEADLIAWLRQILARNLADLVRRFKAGGARSIGREQSLDDLFGATSRVMLDLVAPNAHTPFAPASAATGQAATIWCGAPKEPVESGTRARVQSGCS
jgi:DNA-directed RNA polymerase specialized sigma24 family protein